MIMLEFKLKGKPYQFRAIDEASRTTQFIRNRCVRLWRETRGLGLVEDLRVANMVRNRQVATSISDAGWRASRRWLEYLARVYGKTVVAVPPEYTTQECSRCGTLVKKALSQRTHVCPRCGLMLGRDHNSARVILERGRALLGLNTNYRGASREVTLGETEASTVDRKLSSASAVAEPRIPRL